MSGIDRYRALLSVHVTWYEPPTPARAASWKVSQRDAMRPLADALYRFLGRTDQQRSDAPPSSVRCPPSEGVGIPVTFGLAPDRIDVAETELTAVVLLVDGTTVLDQEFWEGAVARLRKRLEDRGPAGLLIPVIIGGAGAGLESLDGCTMQRLDDVPPERRPSLLVLTVANELFRLLSGGERTPLHLFLSHARADITPTGRAIDVVRDYVNKHTRLNTFLDVHDIAVGQKISDELRRGLSEAVILIFLSDQFSTREWCKKEIVWAKRLRCPTLVIDLLQNGDRRAFPYIGNAPLIPWDPAHPEVLIERATQEALRRRYFQRDAERLRALFDVHVAVATLSRPPELIDCLNEDLGPSDGRAVVLHPDPPLSSVEAGLLTAIRPRWRFITPTALAGTFLDEQAAAPLSGFVVGVSLSEPPDADLHAAGLRREQYDDAWSTLAAHLLSSGSTLAYGGDFRQASITEALINLIQRHNLAVDPALDRGPVKFRKLRCYPTRASNKKLGEKLSAEHVACADFVEVEPPPEVADLGGGAIDDRTAFAAFARMRDVQAMRHQMQRDINARVLIGGRLSGFSGLAPGVLEEAWLALQSEAPLFVVGAFGGAAQAAATALIGPDELPAEFTLPRWDTSSDAIAQRQTLLAEWKRVEEARTPGVPLETIPRTGEELITAFRRAGQLLRDDTALDQLWNNGLTVAENRRLFQTRNVHEIVALILAGLRRLAKQKASQPNAVVPIELRRSDISQVNTQAYWFPVVEGIEVAGSGKSLCARMAGAISAMVRERKLTGARGEVEIIPVGRSMLAGDFAVGIGLGPLSELNAAVVQQAYASGFEKCSALGLKRFATALFGVSCGVDVELSLEALLRSARTARAQGVPIEQISLCEVDPDRFAGLMDALRQNPRVSLSLPAFEENLPTAPSASVVHRIHLDVRSDGGKRYVTSVLPTQGRATALAHAAPDAGGLRQLIEDISTRDSPTNPDDVGDRLARCLFDEDVREGLAKCGAQPLVVVHDPAASIFPFETLCIEGKFPVLEQGLTRTLLADMKAANWLPTRPVSARLRILMVINPTGDLPAAQAEAEEVRKAVGDIADVTRLVRESATADAVLAELQKGAFDILHYAGHGSFDSEHRNRGGLHCADRVIGGDDLGGLKNLPMLVFANACNLGRVRDRAGDTASNGDKAVSVAEALLYAGVANYLGSYWTIGDKSAGEFAKLLYQKLANGETLGEAIRLARRRIYDARSRDWCSYMFFGDPSFRLRRPTLAGQSA